MLPCHAVRPEKKNLHTEKEDKENPQHCYSICRVVILLNEVVFLFFTFQTVSNFTILILRNIQLIIENKLSYYFNINPLCLQNASGNISEGK